TGRRAVFCTLTGQQLDSSYIRRLLPRLATRAGIDKRVHAHGLRHAHAAELVAEGIPVNVIQQQLGHGSLATTDRYLRHIAPRERVALMQGRAWDAAVPATAPRSGPARPGPATPTRSDLR
ncbi:MAG: site-specific integrase, partial [Actinomycetota bacterium]|nr:site-specific integrase [Actinomycetota bacterium]